MEFKEESVKTSQFFCPLNPHMTHHGPPESSDSRSQIAGYQPVHVIKPENEVAARLHSKPFLPVFDLPSGPLFDPKPSRIFEVGNVLTSENYFSEKPLSELMNRFFVNIFLDHR